MNGTVVLLDRNKEKGEEFAKSLVTMVKDNRAFFQECDVTNLESVTSAIDTITKNLDVTILLNCSMDHLVTTYFNVLII
jgi:NAD(P)-dependent dehydrogenase (short-subunit alcohol dehydrogenase family)